MRRVDIFRRITAAALLLAAVLALLPGLSAQAAVDVSDYDFFFERFHVDVVVNPDRSYDITETIDAFFNVESHGILRYIPTDSELEREVRIEDFRVEGDPYESSDANEWRIGDPDKEITGSKRYVIRYTLWHYADEEPDGDYMYLNLIGTGWDVPILNASAAVHLPEGEIMDLTLTGGEFGSTQRIASYTQNGREIDIRADRALEPNEGLTINVRLKEGAFSAAEVWQPNAVYHNVSITGAMDAHGVMDITEQYDLTVNHGFQMERRFPSYYRSDSMTGEITATLPDGTTLARQGEESISLDLSGYAGERIALTIRYALLLDVTDMRRAYTFTLPVLDPIPDCVYERAAAQYSFPFPISDAGVSAALTDSDQIADAAVVFDVNSVSVNADAAAKRNLGMGVQVSTRDGVFLAKQGSYNVIAAVVAMGLLALLFGCSRLLKKRRLIAVPAYYPPDGMNPAELGLIIDNTLSKEDVVSLIYYWASRKALEITMQGKDDFVLRRYGALPANSAPYEVDMFEGLWACGSGDTVEKQDLEQSYYEHINTAYEAIRNAFKDERALNDKKSIVLSALAGFIAPALVSLVCILSSAERGFGAAGNIAGILFSYVFSVWAYCICCRCANNFYKRGAASTRSILWATLLMLLGGFILALSISGGAFQPYAIIILCLSTVLLPYAAAKLRRRTAYGEDMLEKVLGFRMFLNTAERSRLEMLLAENPDYYYDILPYAQVLGVSKIWTKKFAALTVGQPSWSGRDMDGYRTYYLLSRAMRRTMTSEPSSSGGGYSGGGFSGGGSGGGGGGRW